MKHRSWLIVPGNGEARLEQAAAIGSDVVVVDLEDMVLREDKIAARQGAARWLAANRDRQFGRWVRVNALEEGCLSEDLAEIMAAAPDGIILSRSAGPEAVRQLASELYGLEQRLGLPVNSTRIMPAVGETARAALQIGAYLDFGHQRLWGLTWRGAALVANLGGTRQRDAAGFLSDPLHYVRAQTLLTAHAVQVMAIDAPFKDFGDCQRTFEAASGARADGFAGMFAVHPDQVAAINDAFTPSASEFEEAREIVAAFAGSPNVGSLPLRGRMVNRLQLGLAHRKLALEETTPRSDPATPAPVLRMA